MEGSVLFHSLCLDDRSERLQIYIGASSHPSVKDHVENAKLILSVGLLSTDFNTGNFSYAIPTVRHIEVGSLLQIRSSSLD